jgi:hypothetical protein
MKAITQHFIGTTAEWENENPLLYKAVWGIEETQDGKRFLKLGDGVRHWNELPYVDKYMIKGLPEELAHIELDFVPGDNIPEMDGVGSPGDPENWEYSRSTHRHESDTSRLALASEETQIVDSDVALAGGKKLLGVKANGAQANLVSVGDYGTYEQIEVGTESDPLCLNHSAKAPDGTAAGKNIIVNYKDEAGTNRADTVAYGTDVAAETVARQEQVAGVQQTLDSWIGRGGYLDEHDFETAVPEQEAFTAYALAEIGITDPTEIWNGTKVKNMFDGHIWILTNTQDTDPVIFEWTDQGDINISAFTNNSAGVIRGKAPGEGADGYIGAQLDGTGKVNGWDDLKTRFVSGTIPEITVPGVSARILTLIPTAGESSLLAGTEFVAPEDGVYMASAYFGMNTGTGLTNYGIQIYRNGTWLNVGGLDHYPAGVRSPSVCSTYYMQEGEKLHLLIYNDGSGAAAYCSKNAETASPDAIGGLFSVVKL